MISVRILAPSGHYIGEITIRNLTPVGKPLRRRGPHTYNVLLVEQGKVRGEVNIRHERSESVYVLLRKALDALDEADRLPLIWEDK